MAFSERPRNAGIGNGCTLCSRVGRHRPQLLPSNLQGLCVLWVTAERNNRVNTYGSVQLRLQAIYTQYI